MSHFPSDFRDYTLHLDDRGVTVKNHFLKGTTVAIAVTGGIGAVEVPRIIRELRRFGSEVQVYTTSQALQFITPLSLEWASGKKVKNIFTAAAEQVFNEDILLVAPATANIIAKAATGIADDTVSTLIVGALGKSQFILKNYPGRIPPVLLMIPAMHAYLNAHPQFKIHYQTLADNGFTFIESRKDPDEKDKLKMPSPESIAIQVAHTFYHNYYRYQKKSNLFGHRKKVDPLAQGILITAGATSEPIDGVRLLTNRGTGDTGIALANHLHALGFKVYLLVSESRRKNIPNYLNWVSFFEDYTSYKNEVDRILETYPIAWGIFTAAVSDFKPVSFKEEKISSDQALEIKLTLQSKIITDIRKKYPQLTMIVFKYTVNKSIEELTSIAKKMKKDYDFVIANRKEDIHLIKKTRYFFASENETPLISNNNDVLVRQIANVIIDLNLESTEASIEDK